MSIKSSSSDTSHVHKLICIYNKKYYLKLILSGGDPSVLESIDGIDMWEALTQGLTSPRKEFLVNIDPVFSGAAVRIGDWKLMHSE